MKLIPDERVCSFHAGQVWQTRAGFLWRVESVKRGGKAVLRMGSDGSGRIKRKAWDAVGSMTLYHDPEHPDA